MTEGERRLARQAFGAALDPAEVRLVARKLSSLQPAGVVLTEPPRIWFGPGLPRDLSRGTVGRRALLLHELTHLAQARAGMDLWPRGLFAHAEAFVRRRSAYEYDPGPAPLRGRPFEHQAAIVEDAYRMLHGAPPRRQGARLPDLLAALGHREEARASATASLSLGAPPLLNTPLR